MTQGQIKRISRTSGSIFDVAELLALPSDDCNVVFCSSQSLYLMQKFANNEVNWLIRYAQSFTVDGEYYLPTVPGSANIDQIESVIRNYRLEVQVAGCNELVTAMQDLSRAFRESNCGCNVGEGADNGNTELGGTPPADVGSVSYSSPPAFEDRRCLTANWIFDNLLNVVDVLDENSIDDVLNVTLASMVGLVAGLAAGAVASGFGTVFGLAAGALVNMAATVLGGNVSFAAISTAMSNNQEDLVCALYNGFDTDNSLAAYLDVLDTAGLSVENQLAMQAMMNNAILNILSWTTGVSTELEIQGWTATVDCGSCDDCTWSFRDTGEGPWGTGSLTKDSQARQIDAVEGADNLWRIQIELSGTGVCASRNAVMIFGSVDDVTFSTARMRCRAIGGGSDFVWQTAPDGPDLDTPFSGFDMFLTADEAFSINVTLLEGVTPLC